MACLTKKADHPGTRDRRVTLIQRNKHTGELSLRQAERIIETYENGCRNGQHWAHDVVLHRGTASYENHIELLNEAFRIRSINTVVKPLKQPKKKPVQIQMKVPPPARSGKQRIYHE
jgi:hypothetical protein